MWTEIAIWATSLADGVSTYVLLALRIGVEANPLLSGLYSRAPWMAIPISALGALALHALLAAYKKFGVRPLPIYGAVAWRAAVDASNALAPLGLSFASALLGVAPAFYAVVLALAVVAAALADLHVQQR